MILVKKLERNRPLGGIRHSLDDNVIMDHEAVRCEHVDWIQLDQYSVQYSERSNEHPVSEQSVEFLDQPNDYRRPNRDITPWSQLS
jgi:hypothetical protein